MKNSMKAKTLLVSAIGLSTLLGCIEGDNYVRFNDYVTMEAGLLPDTMMLNEPYSLQIRASAPNGCWSNVRVYLNIKSDTAYYFSAVGTYENHGEACSQQLVIHDTIITITPKVEKTHLMYFYNPTGDHQIRTDTVYIKAE